jgi:hypothetical protein
MKLGHDLCLREFARWLENDTIANSDAVERISERMRQCRQSYIWTAGSGHMDSSPRI